MDTSSGSAKDPTSNGAGEYDVFLSHNGMDKPIVCELSKRLESANLRVWLDENQLRPGMPFQDLLERGIRASTSVAVMIGKDGIGPWENEEMRAALQLATRKELPVIPVPLPDAPKRPELPLFLALRTWVDLRPKMTDENLEKLIWGITGEKGPKPSPESGSTSVLSLQALFDMLEHYGKVAFGFGLALVLVILVLAYFVPDPLPFQEAVFRSVLALGLALIAGSILALIKFRYELVITILIRFGVTLSVFFISYILNPAQWVPNPKPSPPLLHTPRQTPNALNSE
jgi:hypothetical protein